MSKPRANSSLETEFLLRGHFGELWHLSPTKLWTEAPRAGVCVSERRVFRTLGRS